MKNAFYRSAVMVSAVIVGIVLTGCGVWSNEAPESEIMYGSVQEILDDHAELNLYRSVLRKAGLDTGSIREVNRIGDRRSLTIFAPTDRAFALYGQARIKKFLEDSTAEQLQGWVSDFTIADKVTYKQLTEKRKDYRLGASIIDAQVLGNDLAIINGMEIGIEDMVRAEDGIVYLVDDFFDIEIEENTDEGPIDTKDLEVSLLEGIPPLYDEYSDQMFQSLRGTDKMVVFFHSDSCITCIEWDDMMSEKYMNLPDGSVVLKADFDTEYALRKDMQITAQSMAVFIDQEGKQLETLFDPEFETLDSFFACTNPTISSSDGLYC